MKRLKWLALLTAAVLLSGCTEQAGDDDAKQFYYIRQSIDYQAGDTVLAPEAREVSGELIELLEIYLRGPESEDLCSPFPEGTTLIGASAQDDSVEIVLSDEFANLTGMELTLACGAVAETCFSFTEASEVRIRAESALLDGAGAITMTTDSLLLTGSTTDNKGDSQ